MKQHKYHYFYKIENAINGKVYYGIHSTDDLDDGYMGSGSRLKEAIKIYGKENFVKTVLKHFPTRDLASTYESEIVTEQLVHDKNCYNLKCGGDYGLTEGTILVRDKNDVFMRVTTDDERYISGELVDFMKDRISVYDKEKGEYVIINNEEYKANKERYVTHSNGMVTVKDKSGNTMSISVNDERYLSGELVPIWTGRKHSLETRKKQSEAHKRTQHQKGEKNSQYGTCWITKDTVDRKILKEELDSYIKIGWKPGRYVDKEKKKTKRKNGKGNQKLHT